MENKRKRKEKKQRIHHKWRKEETEKVMEGINKGWKEHKIKTNFFAGDAPPSAVQIKTHMQRILDGLVEHETGEKKNFFFFFCFFFCL